jgi:hypothetical protein
MLQVMYDVGARVFSNSWGSSDYGKYTVQSRAVDAFMRNNPDALGIASSSHLTSALDYPPPFWSRSSPLRRW